MSRHGPTSSTASEPATTAASWLLFAEWQTRPPNSERDLWPCRGQGFLATIKIWGDVRAADGTCESTPMSVGTVVSGYWPVVMPAGRRSPRRLRSVASAGTVSTRSRPSRCVNLSQRCQNRRPLHRLRHRQRHPRICRRPLHLGRHRRLKRPQPLLRLRLDENRPHDRRPNESRGRQRR